MDLQLYLRVLWRFRLLVAGGVVLATALAILAHVDVSLRGGSPSFTSREGEVWMSQAKIWVTREGFPAGRLATTDEERPGADFAGLAVLYASLAGSDAVRDLMLREGPLTGSTEVKAAESGSGSRASSLPFILIEGFASTPRAAVSMADRKMRALMMYIEEQQRADNTPASERVLLKVLVEPDRPQLLASRSLTRPIVIFLTVMIAVLGLAFILENLRPRGLRPLEQERPVESIADTKRRSA
jgi:hypothetical protein